MYFFRQDRDVKEPLNETSSSLLYTSLPHILQCRIPRLPSLRRTASSCSRAALGHRRYDSCHSRTSTDSETPPPSYRATPRNSTLLVEYDDDQEEFHSLPPSRPSSSGSATPRPPLGAEESGIRWRYARHGHVLLETCLREETSFGSREADFNRKLYLDSLAYLLHGLPEQLTEIEVASLQSTLPVSILLHESNQPGVAAGLELSRQVSVSSNEPRQRQEPTWLHHVVSSLTLYAVLAISFLLPYLQLLLRQAYAYDRKYRISDQIIAQGWMAADVVGKNTVILANSLCAMNDGQVGMKMRDMGMWWLQGVSGGLYEGVGEGMQVLGLRAGDHSAQKKIASR